MGIESPQDESFLQVYFDDQCFLCRNLAMLLQKSHQQRLQVLPLPESPDPRKFLVRSATHLYEDLAAWEFLLQEIPSLRSLSWLPVKIFGLQETAATLKKTAEYWRRLCLRCRRSI